MKRKLSKIMNDRNNENFSLINSYRNKDYQKLIALIYIYFSYWLGIIQDFYYGVMYFLNIINNQEISGSFPFMFGWTAIMFWGVLKPIERRATLFLTGLLVSFMVVQNFLLLSISKFEGNPYIQIFGALLWFSAYAIANILEKMERKN
ncbi:MAG: hypothetical protein ACFFAO_01595 [Candidatus Hermodarchaeota archaeon]